MLITAVAVEVTRSSSSTGDDDEDDGYDDDANVAEPFWDSYGTPSKEPNPYRTTPETPLPGSPVRTG